MNDYINEAFNPLYKDLLIKQRKLRNNLDSYYSMFPSDGIHIELPHIKRENPPVPAMTTRRWWIMDWEYEEAYEHENTQISTDATTDE